MHENEASQVVVSVLGDVVGSRLAQDRRGLHAVLVRALASADARTHPLRHHRVTAGDEFQGTFRALGQALQATLLIRLELLPEVDVRFGLGLGEVTVLDEATGTQDGPGWWSAREAIDWTKATSESPGLRHVRTAYRRSTLEGPDEAAVGAALLCRDQLVGSLDDRSLRILRGLMTERSQSAIAAEEGVSPSAISQRVRSEGLAVIVRASRWLQEIG